MTCFIKICRKRSANAANRLFALDSIDFFKELYQTLIQAAVCQQSQTSNTFPKLVLPMISNLEKTYIHCIGLESMFLAELRQWFSDSFAILFICCKLDITDIECLQPTQILCLRFSFILLIFSKKGIFYSMFII